MLYLASRSPRRHELIAQLGLSVTLLQIDVPEVRLATESPESYVSRVAREKARSGFLQVTTLPGAVVIGADTEVVLADVVFGKPPDALSATATLKQLAGRTHRVISAVWCVNAEKEKHALSISEVSFKALSDTEIETYVRTGEPFGKAGAYAIQGRAAAFVRWLSGSYSGVMGLPLYETASLLRDFNVCV